MDANRGLHFDWCESSVFEEFDGDFAKTFCRHKKDSDSRITRFCNRDLCEGEMARPAPRPIFSSDDLTCLAVSSRSLSSSFSTRSNSYEAALDVCQIYCIHQKNSYSRLNVTCETFSRLIRAYGIFERFWDIVLPFSFRTRESDVGHAPFRFRQSQPILVKDATLGNFGTKTTFVFASKSKQVQNARTASDKLFRAIAQKP